MAGTELLVESPRASSTPTPPAGGPLPSTAPPRRSTRGRWLRLAIALVVLAAGAILLRRTVFAPAPLAVNVARVTRGEVEETVTNSRAGTVKARHRAQLSPDVGGRVLELPFHVGDHVTKGAVLMRLDDSVVSAQLDVSRRDLAAAEAQGRQACLAAEQARRDLERNRSLAAQGIVSADVLDRLATAASTQAAGCEASHRGVERAGAAVSLARAEVGRTVLRAPFDAVIAQQSTHVGEFVTPAPPGVPMPPVMDLIDPSTNYVSAPMDEVDSARLRTGLPARVVVDSHPGRHLPGHVVRVGAYVLDVEEQNRTVEIEIELDDAGFAARLLPGTSADVEVVLETHDDVLRVPTAALLSGDRVLVVASTRLAEHPVEVGLRNWDVTEVRGGLAEGDVVVVSLDRPEVKAGAHVVVESDVRP